MKRFLFMSALCGQIVPTRLLTWGLPSPAPGIRSDFPSPLGGILPSLALSKNSGADMALSLRRKLGIGFTFVMMAASLLLFASGTIAKGKKDSNLEKAVEEIIREVNRFELYSNCGPMKFRIKYFDIEEKKIKLTQQSVQNSIESRLRSARLYDVNGASSLEVGIIVVNSAYSIEMEYSKYVYDKFSNTEGFAVTWQTGSTGTHGGNSSYILSSLAEHLDKFLVEYLRVNEKACEKR